MPPVPLGRSCSSTGCQPWHWRNTAVRPLPFAQSPATPRGRWRSSAHVGSGCSDASCGARCAPHAVRHRTHAPRSVVAPITKRPCCAWHGLHALRRCALHAQDHVSCGTARGSAAAAAAAPTSARCRSRATSAHASASGWLCTRYGLPTTRACFPTTCLGIHGAAGDLDLCVSDQRHVECDDRVCESRIDVPAAVRPVGLPTTSDNRVMLLIAP